ncbi:transmembrane protein [Holotrichia oblita]|uniref:Transmembrane protein n=2 Tax=Holotrichia oblita TaxID=644536 RepID=A0ACB9TPW2_HOLOL|nr:transmembrane protein [Holotrichia oblita]KAI4468845.1 transmembrane protein [Holotrichia oblita]
MDYRSPLENIINIFGSLPQGHDKPVKQAVYNALALFLLFLGCAAACALYLILEPFIKPLMWALLVGSVLHPLKYKLAQRFKSWFDGLDESNTPVVFGILLVPVNVIDNISELLGNKLLNHLKIIISVLIIIPCTHLIYFYTPKFLVNFVIHISHGSSHFIAFLIDNANTALVICLLLGYATAVVFLWSPENNFRFHCASTLVWFLLACYLANLCGSLKIVIFVILQLLFLGGFFLELYYIQQYIASTGSPLSLFDYLRDCFKNQSFVTLNNSDVKDGKEKLINTKIVTSDSPTEVKDETDKSKSIDPWTLELFQKSTACESKDKRTGILITDKGNIHIYAEGIMLVQMTSNVINQTVVHNPELRQLLPPTFDDTVDSLLDNAYQYGREGISKVVKSIMSDVDPAKSEKFEKQVLELWDRIYQTWMTTDHNGPKVTQEAVQHSWDRFVNDIQKSPGDIFLYSRNSMENVPVPDDIVRKEVEYPNNSDNGASA